MAKHLTAVDVDSILRLINHWKDQELTWEAICSACTEIVGKKPTRQSLAAFPTIKIAYVERKKKLTKLVVKTPQPSSLKLAAERIERLEDEISYLKATNTALLEQFVKWQYNAYRHGMKEHQLNASILKIDRERSDA